MTGRAEKICVISQEAGSQEAGFAGFAGFACFLFCLFCRFYLRLPYGQFSKRAKAGFSETAATALPPH